MCKGTMTGKVFMYGQCVSILYRNSRHELFSRMTQRWSWWLTVDRFLGSGCGPARQLSMAGPGGNVWYLEQPVDEENVWRSDIFTCSSCFIMVLHVSVFFAQLNAWFVSQRRIQCKFVRTHSASVPRHAPCLRRSATEADANGWSSIALQAIVCRQTTARLLCSVFG